MKKLTIRLRDSKCRLLEERAFVAGISQAETLRRALLHPPLRVADHGEAGCVEGVLRQLDAARPGTAARIEAHAVALGLTTPEALTDLVFLGLYFASTQGFLGATEDATAR